MNHARAVILLALILAGIILIGGSSRRSAAAGPAEPAGVDPRVFAVSLDGDRAYLARTRELLIASIEDPTDPRPLGTIPLPFTPRRLAVDGTRVYVAGDTHGLVVIDAADPAAATIVLEHDGYARVRDALPLGAYVLLAAHRDGLHVLDVSRPARPQRVARVSTRGELTALSLDGTRLATAEGQAGVRLFDLSHAERPRELRRWTRSAAGASDVELVGDRLWVAAGRRGLLVLDPDRDEVVRHEIAFERPVHALARDGERMLVIGSRTAFLLPLDRPDAEPLRIESPRRPSLADAALTGELAALALSSGWALVRLDPTDGPRRIWPVERRIRVRFD